MQQFVVPQFIDVEDKVIGPITVRQFVIILVGMGINFIAYKLSDFTLFVFWFFIISFITFSFAFIRINGRPLHYFVLNFTQTLRRPNVRTWDRELSKIDLKRYTKNKEENLSPQITVKAPVQTSRLAELALIVDTGGVYQGVKEPPRQESKEAIW